MLDIERRVRMAGWELFQAIWRNQKISASGLKFIGILPAQQ